MSNPLLQTIEALAKEKGIEPDVVITAIEEAVATASRKYYKATETGENLKTRFNTDTGQVDLFALKQVVEEVSNTATEIAIDRGAADVQPAVRRRRRQQHRARRRDRVPEADRSARPHRRADRQAGDLPEGSRGGAREHLRRVQPAHRRSGERHDQALRKRRHHHRSRAASRRCSRARSSRGPRATRRPTACARSSRASTAARRARRSCCRAPIRRCSSSCSSRKCPEIYDGTV